ncbi:MAG: DUF4176 domain-containing protein [Bacilli bacterium]|nr:DUF4176 domain-containing protein [Bacilli bacterium]
MIDKYLPIGTIVILKGGRKRLMITGFACKSEETNNQLFDYCGCLYPEGVIFTDKSILFNHDQIEHIFFMGYVDEDEKAFKVNLEKIVSNMNNN